MSSRQYTLQFDEVEDIRSYYVDQSVHNSTYGHRSIMSAYTPWGISKIDEQY